MTDVARLLYEVDSVQIERATRALDEMVASAGRAERSTDGLNKAAKEATSATDRMRGETKKASQELDNMNTRTGLLSGSLSRLAGLAAGIFAGFKIAGVIKDSAQLNSRFEQMNNVLTVVGSNAGYSAEQVNRYAQEVQDMGITMIESRQTIISMIQAQMDLEQASKLARLAQDAAVLGNINSTEALRRLINGLQSGQVEILKGIGLNVNFEKSYRDMEAQLSRTRGGLNEAEKAQARVNAVIAAAGPIAGAYEASMDSANKQLGSTARYVEDLQVKWGAMFSEANKALVFGYSDALKGLLAITDRLHNGGQIEYIGKMIMAVRDAAVVAAIALSAHLGVQLVANTGSFILAQIQAARYAISLNAVAGASFAAAAGQAALSGSLRIVTRVLAVLGGAAGVAGGVVTILIALAGAAFYFREEIAEAINKVVPFHELLGMLTAPLSVVWDLVLSLGEAFRDGFRSAVEFSSWVTSFLPELDLFGSTVGTVALALLGGPISLVGGLIVAKENLGAIRDFIPSVTQVVRFLRDEIEDASQWIIFLAKSGLNMMSGNLRKTVADWNALQNALSSRKSERELRRTLEAIQKIENYFRLFNRAGKEAAETIEEVGEESKDAAKGVATLSDEAQKVLDKLYPLKLRARELEQELAHLKGAFKDGLINQKALDDWYEKNLMISTSIREELIPAIEQTKDEANPMAAAWEEALGRVDKGFEDLWSSAFKGFEDFSSTLKSAFIQLLATLAHQATTQKILINLGLGGVGQGGGGGLNFGSIISAGKTIWNGVTGLMGGQGLSGFGSSISSGLNPIGSAFNTGLNFIGEAGAKALYNLGYQQAASNWSLGFSGYAQSLVDTGQTVGGWMGLNNLSTNAYQGLGGMVNAGAGWVGGRVGSDLGRSITGKEGSGWGATGGAIIGSIWGPIGSAIGGLIGGVVDSIFGSSAWNTTRGGIQLGFGEDGFDPMMWERQTKKGGLFGSTKRRYRYDDLDPALAAEFEAIYETAQDSVRDMYATLGVTIEDGLLEGVRIATLQIGTSGKSKQAEEEIQEQIAQWFTDLTDAMVAAVDPRLTAVRLTELSAAMSAVNTVLDRLNLRLFDVSVEGAEFAETLLLASGGLEGFLAGSDAFFNTFYSAGEKFQLLGTDLRSGFDRLGLVMPSTREALRDLVNGLDLTTVAGMDAFVSIMSTSEALGQFYTTLDSYTRAISQSFGGLQDRIIMDLLQTAEAQYGYLKNQADSLAASIQDLSDPASIAQVVREIERLSDRAYGLLDEEGRREQGAEYLEFIAGVQQRGNDALIQAQERQTEEANEKMEAALTRVVETAVSGLAQVFQSAELSDRQVAAAHQAASHMIVDAVRNIGRGGEQNA